MARTLPELAVVGFVALLIGVAVSAHPVMGGEGATPIPDFSGIWGRTAMDHEALLSGPSPVINMNRLPGGTSDPQRPAGDYHNPILNPQAAEVLRKRGEGVLNGKPFSSPSNQCAPYPPPYIFAVQLGMKLLQGRNAITILYSYDQQVRYVRLNATHPTHVTPSSKGDSIGHYEGDTLVIDTIGIKAGPLAMVDRYGTPFSEALHVVERYRLIDAREAREAAERHEKKAGHLRGAVDIDPDYGKGLQLIFTVEDANVFVMPWSASITYRRATNDWPELVCAENTHEYYAGTATKVPQADKPDF